MNSAPRSELRTGIPGDASMLRTLSAMMPGHDDTIINAIRNIAMRERSLTREEAYAVMARLLSGNATDAQIAALLIALQNKGETVEEIVGFAEAVRQAATPILGGDGTLAGPNSHERNRCIDMCGTGGDGHGTFNISTVATFIVAGAGVKVAKHGNRALSSRCGSADVMEALGVRIDLPAELLSRALNEVGITFLFAPGLHPAVRQIQQVRREIRIKSIFNLLGPLTNPALPSGQVVGVYSEQLAFALASALMKSGVSRALVVHGSDGLDEITITGPTRIFEARDGWLRDYYVTPEQFGMERAPLSAIFGGDAQENSGIIQNILNGERSACRDIALMNAAAGLVVAGKSGSLEEALPLARESLDSGRALSKLRALIEFTSCTAP
jgi:anthranilate phosphoribosyltransferase